MARFLGTDRRHLCYVAVTSDNKKVGQLVGTFPKQEWKPEDQGEWEPELPEGTDTAFIQYFLGIYKAEHAEFVKDDMFGLYPNL
jgi:hypothetical protein